MDFETALGELKRGKKLSRVGWNGKGLCIEIQSPDEHSKMTLPYIYLSYPVTLGYPFGARVPWFPSQTDLLSEDWRVEG